VKWILGALAALCVAMLIGEAKFQIAEMESNDAAARVAGFENQGDWASAKLANVTDPAEWKERKKIEAEEKRKLAEKDAKEKAEREAAERKVRDIREARFQEGLKFALLLREGMKNPDSFNLERTVYSPSDAFCYSYRATNSFNAIVPGRAVKYPGGFSTDSDRNFSSVWSKHCGRGGEDFDTIGYALKNAIPRR
jgi:hypothetical protein